MSSEIQIDLQVLHPPYTEEHIRALFDCEGVELWKVECGLILKEQHNQLFELLMALGPVHVHAATESNPSLRFSQTLNRQGGAGG